MPLQSDVELRAQLAKTIRQMADLAEQREFSAQENEHWSSVNRDYDAATRRIETATRSEAVTRTMNEPLYRADRERIIPGRGDVNHGRYDDELGTGLDGGGDAEQNRAMALQAWTRAQCGLAVTERHAEAAAAVGMNIHSPTLDFRIAPTPDARAIQRAYKRNPNIETRAMSAVSLTAGASTIPQGFMNSLEIALLQYGGMRTVSEILRTESGNEMPWPGADDTGATGERIGENTTVGEADVVTNATRFFAYKYSSKLVKVPVELMEDSAFDLAATLGDLLGTRIGRIQNTDFTTGTGAAQPNGLITSAGLGITTASPTAIAADEIIQLTHSVDPAYRTGSGVGFMMHDLVLQAIRLLKDGQGRYLWQPGAMDGVPDRLYGFPYQINQSMASAAIASAKTIAFGDLSKYKIRDVRNIRLRRLVERYAENDMEGFIAFMRSDGALLQPAAVKYLQQHA